ncbi:MAG: sigma-54-dependent Fis family transcriptional regulator [Spirochaetia bacterium]|nr:sigma-54-dependent Fis family transcriptional regulator [Spirochaetia bacterium]
MKFNILVVDDEINIRRGLAMGLADEGYEVLEAGSGTEAVKILASKEVDLVITDLKMPEMTGDELLKHITANYKNIPVIILTGHGTIETAVQMMHDGAYDFMTKPLNLDHLFLIIKRALSNRQLILEHNELQAQVEKMKATSNMIVGKSPKMRQIMETVEQVAGTRASILLTGESGTGKEVIADAIQALSDRRDKPFIKVHCAALAESLIESELFGHEKGAFTNAFTQKKGKFELADKGTIFLDEIGEINQNIQVKLLRIIQEREFERVGGTETIKVDVRIISATNKNLRQEVQKGTFREDLFYRLNVVNIEIPPLRERKEDILLMATAFMNRFAKENNKQITGMDSKVMAILYNHPWRGNIRELENCMENAVIMCRGNMIMVDDLPFAMRKETGDNFIKIKLGTTMDNAEKTLIMATLDMCKGNKSKAAEVLAIGRKTLHRKLDEYAEN